MEEKPPERKCEMRKLTLLLFVAVLVLPNCAWATVELFAVPSAPVEVVPGGGGEILGQVVIKTDVPIRIDRLVFWAIDVWGWGKEDLQMELKVWVGGSFLASARLSSSRVVVIGPFALPAGETVVEIRGKAPVSAEKDQIVILRTMVREWAVSDVFNRRLRLGSQLDRTVSVFFTAETEKPAVDFYKSQLPYPWLLTGYNVMGRWTIDASQSDENVTVDHFRFRHFSNTRKEIPCVLRDETTGEELGQFNIGAGETEACDFSVGATSPLGVVAGYKREVTLTCVIDEVNAGDYYTTALIGIGGESPCCGSRFELNKDGDFFILVR